MLLISLAIYQCKYAGCNSHDINETTCHFCSTVLEHLLTAKNYHAYLHLFVPCSLD